MRAGSAIPAPAASLRLIGFDEALAKVAAAAVPLGHERVALADAHGRILAARVVAGVSAPPVDVSAMDGFAVRDADLVKSSALPVAGESFPGHAFAGSLPPGCCVRVFTGAAVPEGADRVVVQEVVTREGELAVFPASPGRARHIRHAGSDFAPGDTLVQPGRRVGPGALTAAAGADVAELTVFRRPRVRLLVTGDELVEPGAARARPDRIPESVSYGIAALVAEAGAAFLGKVRLPDNLPLLTAAAERALGEADVVVVTGGASVGERDFAKAMFEPHGLDLIFSKVAMRPGKPVWLGKAGPLVIGLPGNPSSALVTARLLLVPLLYGLAGRDAREALRWRQLPLAAPLSATGDRETFWRGFENYGRACLSGHQDSNGQKTLGEATLLIRSPAGNVETPAGSAIDVLDL